MTDKYDNEAFEHLYREGTRLLHERDPGQAIPFLEQACDVDPFHADAALNLAGAYILSKRFEEAADLLESIVERDPRNHMAWINLGAAYLGNPVLAREDEHKKAIDAFVKAWEIDPMAPHVAYNIGLVYRDRQQWIEAAYWFQEALAANPADDDARNLLAKMRSLIDEEE